MTKQQQLLVRLLLVYAFASCVLTTLFLLDAGIRNNIRGMMVATGTNTTKASWLRGAVTTNADTARTSPPPTTVSILDEATSFLKTHLDDDRLLNEYFVERVKEAIVSPAAADPETNDSTTHNNNFLVVYHKMGTVLARQLVENGDLPGPSGMSYVRDSEKYIVTYPHVQVPKRGDGFRSVVIVRNIYDSLVSGYLYHLR